MNIGTKSVLFGAHCFLLHPWFVAAAWWRTYGFPWDPRLWFAFALHDIGYLGKPNMDGAEGEAHPFTGARIMGLLFGPEWFDFTLYHSRFLAKAHGKRFSRLCVADKLSICLTPAWLYLPMANWTGEIHEYMAKAANGKYDKMNMNSVDQRIWYENVRDYLGRWASRHAHHQEGSWMP